MIPFVSAEGWPNTLDALLTIAFLALVVLVPALGYVFMALDLRTYLRSLRRSLVAAGRYLPELPDWAQQQTPRAIAALGLRMPCTEDDLKGAYRARVKQLHPDHGGDQRRFLILQANFEEALQVVRSTPSVDGADWPQGHHAV